MYEAGWAGVRGGKRRNACVVRIYSSKGYHRRLGDGINRAVISGLTDNQKGTHDCRGDLHSGAREDIEGSEIVSV